MVDFKILFTQIVDVYLHINHNESGDKMMAGGNKYDTTYFSRMVIHITNYPVFTVII